MLKFHCRTKPEHQCNTHLVFGWKKREGGMCSTVINDSLAELYTNSEIGSVAPPHELLSACCNIPNGMSPPPNPLATKVMCTQNFDVRFELKDHGTSITLDDDILSLGCRLNPCFPRIAKKARTCPMSPTLCKRLG